jgi:hypothetical protein
MKKHSLFSFLTLAVLITILIGCKSDEIEDISPIEPDPEPPVNVEIVDWEKLQSIDQRIINAKNFEGKVHAIGVSEIFLDIKQEIPPAPFSKRSFLTRIGRYMSPFNNEILVTRTESEIFIFDLNNLDENNALRISGSDLDENFKSFEDIPLWNGELMGLSLDGHVLIPFRNVVNGIALDNPSFALLELEMNNGTLEVKNKTIIEEQIFFSFNTCNRVQSFSDFFTVQIGSRVFRISAEGEMVEIFNNSNVIFNFGEELRTFELDRAANEFVLQRGTIDGLNWSVLGRFPNLPALRNARFTEIDNKIIGFEGIDIFEVQLVGGDINLKYLQDNNLQGGAITSILSYEDQVLITTNCVNPSTNCGVFLKSKEDFFLPKP